MPLVPKVAPGQSLGRRGEVLRKLYHRYWDVASISVSLPVSDISNKINCPADHTLTKSENV